MSMSSLEQPTTRIVVLASSQDRERYRRGQNIPVSSRVPFLTASSSGTVPELLVIWRTSSRFDHTVDPSIERVLF